jgi:beta-glucosidase
MDIRWGRTYEGYGQDITLVSELGGAYVKGLSEKVGSLGLTATAKHYIGEGYTVG